jgi:hypothetical protein
MGIRIGAEAQHGQGFLDGVGQRLLRRLTISGHAVLGLVLVPGAPVLLDLAALPSCMNQSWILSVWPISQPKQIRLSPSPENTS